MKFVAVCCLLISTIAPAYAKNAAGCGLPAVKHNVTEELVAPVPKPTADKALVFVIRNTSTHWHFQSKVALDGRWAGVLKHKTYTAFYLEPGTHEFCSAIAGMRDHRLSLDVEAGKTYFLEQHIDVGMTTTDDHFELLQPDDGWNLLAGTARATMAEK